jgi:hypothetical protein
MMMKIMEVSLSKAAYTIIGGLTGLRGCLAP